MIDLTTREIIKASGAIDRELGRMTVDNRGETAVNILNAVRNLNDNIAHKIWHDIHTNQPMSVNKVASKFWNVRNYQFIARFDKYLRKSLSHFTPSVDGGARLLIKYYQYIIRLKKIMYERYKIEIIKNVDKFLQDLDTQTNEYYNRIADQIQNLKDHSKNRNFDNYYISKSTPFFRNGQTFFEVELEPVDEKTNKFNRITAFTKHNMIINYSVALSFTDRHIVAFDIDFPIKIITDWKVSIRPCEIRNFARILNQNITIERSHKEYILLMDILTYHELTLVDLIDLENSEYEALKDQFLALSKDSTSKIFTILDKCKEITLNNTLGVNILRYLLNHMTNRIIKDQWPYNSYKSLPHLYLSKGSLFFDSMPFYFNPKGHVASLENILECINSENRKFEFFARYIRNNTERNGLIYTHINDLKFWGDKENILKLAQSFNEQLDDYTSTEKIEFYGDYIFQNGVESKTVDIIEQLINLSSKQSNYSNYFNNDAINTLTKFSGVGNKLDDPQKMKILETMYQDSSVHFIYGSAGTGKSTLINHVSNIMSGTKRIFLAKTNPAVENLRRKITNQEETDEFLTIDRFTKSKLYTYFTYDLIVVDECSTVKNDEILKILALLGDGNLLLAGDIHQIESIGFGNWFSLVKNGIPSHCYDELTHPFRSTDNNLIELWDEVRKLPDNNLILEIMVRNDYSNKIDKNIFNKIDEDEIILCLNYNGLYGLNNINKLLQLNNPSKSVDLGISQFKENDPILFNDSKRFEALFNNLKGKILKIQDEDFSINFTIEVDISLNSFDESENYGLTVIETNSESSIVSFKVFRRPPYSSDDEPDTNYHILPFQLAYAVSIHKSQGLEYNSVKIVIADDTEDQITHNILYTAITRSKKYLNIFWSEEVSNRVLSRLEKKDSFKEYLILKNKYDL